MKVDSWSNELVVRWSRAGTNVSREAEDVIVVRHQATTDEDIPNWEDFILVYAAVSDLWSV
jgi:hypothetical protein